jgi:hypothetical protein
MVRADVLVKERKQDEGRTNFNQVELTARRHGLCLVLVLFIWTGSSDSARSSTLHPLHRLWRGLRSRSLLSLFRPLTLSSFQAFDVGGFLEQTSPYAWALIGVGLNIGLSVAGAGW